MTRDKKPSRFIGAAIAGGSFGLFRAAGDTQTGHSLGVWLHPYQPLLMIAFVIAVPTFLFGMRSRARRIQAQKAALDTTINGHV